MGKSEGMVILLTGASRGIGSSVAHYLLSHHHKLLLTSRTQSSLDSFSTQYGTDHVEVLVGDMADALLPGKAVERALERWGRIDALIVNHGTLEPVKKVGDSTVEEWKGAFEVNAFSAVGLIAAALPSLRAAKGRVILTSSGAAVSAYQGWAAYGAAKAVLNHLALTLSVEESNVTTIALRPGVVDSEMQRDIREVHLKKMSEKDGKKFLGLKEDGELLKPEQPGHVIAKLAVGAGHELSGKFLSWNDESLEQFQ